MRICRVGTIFVVLLLSLFLAAASGCDSNSGDSASSGETVMSEVLRAELDRVLNELLVNSAPARTSQQKTTLNASRTVTELTMETPRMLEVTAAEEAKFKRKEFDDAANRTRVAQAEKIINPSKGGGPRLTRYLFEQHRKQPLTGVRLELLAHLAERNAKLMTEMNKQSKK